MCVIFFFHGYWLHSGYVTLESVRKAVVGQTVPVLFLGEPKETGYVCDVSSST